MVSKKQLKKFNEKQSVSYLNKVNKNIGRERKRKSFIAIAIVLILVALFLSAIVSSYMNSTGQTNVLFGLFKSISVFIDSPQNFVFDVFGTNTLVVTLSILIATILILVVIKINDERYLRDLPESSAGSAKWQDDYKEFNKVFGDKDEDKNTILADDVVLTTNDWYSGLNNNILCIGGSGMGKSRGLVKPNILQANSNMVITDPSGELLASTGHFLQKEKQYTIKIFNLVEFQKSNRYNPLKYVRSDTDVESLITCLIANTSGDGGSHGEKFWEDAEKSLLSALIYLLYHHFDPQYRNFSHVMKLLRWSKADESGKRSSWLERIFLEPEGADFITDDSALELREWFENMYYYEDGDEVNGKKIYNRDCLPVSKFDTSHTDVALKNFRIFHSAPAKTANGVVISAGVRLHSFNTPQIARLTDEDDIELDEISGINEEYLAAKKRGEKPMPLKQVLFVIIPAAQTTYNFLVSMMYSQLFDRLYRIGEQHCVDRGMRLPVDVRFWLDEFANIGTIPDFTTRLSTMRKYGINCGIILQGVTQIQKDYEKDWGTIFANCNTIIFLGGQEQETMEYISKQLGDQTIHKRSNTIQKSSKGERNSYGGSEDKRPLLSPSEVARINKMQCIIIIAGIDPFLTNKYTYENHKNYKYTADADKSLIYINTLDITEPSSKEMKAYYLNKKEEEAKIKTTTIKKLIEDHDAWVDYPNICAKFLILTTPSLLEQPKPEKPKNTTESGSTMSYNANEKLELPDAGTKRERDGRNTFKTDEMYDVIEDNSSATSLQPPQEKTSGTIISNPNAGMFNDDEDD